MHDLRICKDIIHCVDRPRRNTTRLAGGQKRLLGHLDCFRPQNIGDGIAVLQARGVGRIGGIIGNIRQAQHRAKLAKLPVIAHCNNDMPVRTFKHLIGHDIGVGIPQTLRHLAGTQVIHRLIGHHGGRDIHQCHINVLPLARHRALVHRRQNRRSGINSGENIRKGDPHLLRLSGRIARDRHQAGHALNDVVVSGPFGIRAILPKPRYRAIDQSRIQFVQAVIIKPVFRQPANLEVLNQDISVSDQLQ